LAENSGFVILNIFVNVSVPSVFHIIHLPVTGDVWQQQFCCSDVSFNV